MFYFGMVCSWCIIMCCQNHCPRTLLISEKKQQHRQTNDVRVNPQDGAQLCRAAARLLLSFPPITILLSYALYNKTLIYAYCVYYFVIHYLSSMSYTILKDPKINIILYLSGLHPLRVVNTLYLQSNFSVGNNAIIGFIALHYTSKYIQRSTHENL